jgi:hypothetical protein
MKSGIKETLYTILIVVASLIICLVVLLGYRSKDYYVDNNGKNFSIDGKAIGFSLEYSESDGYANDYVNIYINKLDKNVNLKSIVFYFNDSHSRNPFVTDVYKESGRPFFYISKEYKGNIDLTVTYTIDSLYTKVKKQETWKQLKKKKHIWFNWAFH